jgi:PAS domain-containing protein
MSFMSRPPDDVTERRPTGSLSVGVPHWAAQVRIYDDRFRLVDGAVVQESRQAPGRYQAAAELSPGIYEVEVTLAGQSQRQLVAVYPGQTVQINQDAWKLELSSAAPLADTVTTREWHMEPAETWSRQVTWPEAPGGDSRLFLFVRTAEPERYPRFANGLFLLDADGRLITDLAEGVRKSPEDGWLAFNADLPAGYYILRRGRSGVRVRYQPLYLCAGWETQVFVAAPRGRPALRTLTLNMAPLGAGFRSDNETTVVAEALFDSLRRVEGDAVITFSEKLSTLLTSTYTDPWLSILAAYALLRSRAGPRRESPPNAARNEADLLPRVLESLSVVEAHPDARAARLRDDEPAAAPFWHPPLLRVGLARVRRHATRYAETVPLNSLTDCVLDNLVTNSPWTAWRRLDRLPRPARAALTTERVGPQMLAHQAPDLADASSYTAAFVEAAPPNAPVYRLAIGPEIGDATAAEEPPALAAPATISTLLEAPVLQKAQALTETGDPTTLPETATLDPARNLSELLEGVEPKAVSADSGVPLARTTESLEQLRRLSAEAPPSAPDQPTPVLTAAEQAILEYALKKTAPAVPGEAALPSDAAPGAEPSVTIEKYVATLRTEADRLLLRPDDEQWKAAGGDPATARALGMRLRRVADELLRHADFIVLIDPDGRLLYGNGAFVQLTSPTDDLNDDLGDQRQRRRGARQQQRRMWEAALVGTSPGHSTLTAPIPNPISKQWELSRTVIKDDVDGRPRADLVVFRSKDVPPLDPAAFDRINTLLSELTQCASFFAYGSTEHRTEYVQRLESLIVELEQLARASADRHPNR